VKLFRSHDPLFPPAEIRVAGGVFKVVGLKRDIYKTANALRHAIRAAFVRADLPAFSAHAFRKRRATWADTIYPTRDAFKAVLQYIGHTSVIMTVSVHFPVSTALQADLIRKRSQFVRYVRASANDAAVARL
jgi:integrase/recombinase XerD